MAFAYPKARLRSLTVITILSKRYHTPLPVDCLSVIWELLIPRLVGFTSPLTLAKGIRSTACCRTQDCSSLLVVKRKSICECSLLEIRSSGELIDHGTLDIGFLLCLGVEPSSGDIIAVEQNTGRSFAVSQWKAHHPDKSLAPKWGPWRTLVDFMSKPTMSSNGYFYGLSWRGASVLRIGPDESTKIFYDCGGTCADGLAIFERDGQPPQILLLHRANGRSSSSTLSAISMDGKPLGTIAELDLVGCDLDVDSNRGLCFVVGYYSGSLTVCITDLHSKTSSYHSPLQRLIISRFFARDDGGLWLISKEGSVLGLDPIFA
ncbi:hypothetical protein FOL47_006809 [Perkinsus chesapeaki]|uniref:Uncharacterized protein n=1 Tax=Perkinsus chesapeaki TaxID=330153 RepID=A0A7J6MWK6_PERCH|nr:hypothetical protein FOL47_006809 [Perkinsus chesapeaki]